ncbi:hypothetical protein CL1_0299 [Thermococcus cleftensis]|uniref:DUF86 domain-containing protein n=1 Tax=Thermococcus cleftensis (strain DSM 27260 / KACC 17922 / CL1) TaxID=163003 RepID=I3ZS26_THECF|nr:HepT-like ribonuclease domain-containing protein [Thermococcus cleftensis]AFL94510.1 hypothetical protein CL1_0299 [Thermococcus cleftensis]
MDGEKVLESVELIRKSLPPTLEEFRAMGLAKDGIYKRLEFATGLVLVGLYELAEEQGIRALSYDDAVRGLAERSILPEHIAEKAIFLVRLREVLMYDYDLINDEIAFRDMGEYLEFIEEVLAFLSHGR